MTQQQVKALEEEARTRMQADEVRAARFGEAMERVSHEVQSLAARVRAEENGTSQRVAILEVIRVRVRRATAIDRSLFYIWPLGKSGKHVSETYQMIVLPLPRSE